MKIIITALVVIPILISVLTACNPKRGDVSFSKTGTDTVETVASAARGDNTDGNGKVHSGEEGRGEIKPLD